MPRCMCLPLQAALRQFNGDIMQRPPAFSALKIAGQRSSDMARAGTVLELPPRPVRVHELSCTGWQPPGGFQLSLRCSGGTYVRSLVHDLGIGKVGPFLCASGGALPLQNLLVRRF